MPLDGEPDPPEWFTERQAATWEQYAAELRGMGLLHTADADALTSLVLAVCHRDDDARLLADEGLTVEGRRGGQVRHPAWLIMRYANADILRFPATLA